MRASRSENAQPKSQTLIGMNNNVKIFAGLCLNCAVFGALLRPLELVAVKMPPPGTIHI